MALDSFGKYTKGVEPIRSSTVTFLICLEDLIFLYNNPIIPADTKEANIAIERFLSVIYW